MSTASSIRFLSLATMCAAVLASQPALARDRQATVSNANGQSATRDVNRLRGDVATSTTTANGKVLGTRTVDRNADGTTATATGPKGGAVTRESVPTDTGSSTTVTGPKGQSGSVQVTR